MGMVVRLGLALLAIAGSFALAYTLLSRHNNAAHAAGTTIATGHKAWGLSLSADGNLWIAEPDCAPEPVCGGSNGSPTPTPIPPPTGAIGHIVGGTLSEVALPATGGYSAPEFIVPDNNGHAWFTMPSTDAIGYISLANPITNSTFAIYPAAAGSGPRDLVMDGHGNLWITEGKSNKIAFFDTTAKTFTETAIPTAGADPYGIVDSGGKIWFTENGSTKLGSFAIPATGGTISITESPITGTVHPHLLAADATGNLWYSEGSSTAVGEFIPSTSTSHDYSVSTAVCPPAPASCSGAFVGGVSVDKNGQVYFDEDNVGSVGILNPATGNATAVNTGNSPDEGLVVDGTGNVFASSKYNPLLVELPAGTLVAPTGSPTPTLTPPSNLGSGPVSPTWYFAEGRVGAGFREYLTLENPGITACTVSVQYFETPENGNPPLVVPATFTIAAQSRITRAVHGDLNIPDSSPTGAAVSAVVNATGCNGIVAERPIYFAGYHGLLSAGTDALGTTKLNNAFNFADFPYDGTTMLSFITILNPGTTAASVTAIFYNAGAQVATKTITVNGQTRGTIFPNQLSAALPPHTSVAVTSTVPVAVERPSYIVSANGTAASAGASDVLGAPALGNDWLFAEGFTGPGFQEYLTVANLTNTAVSATVTLKSQSGATFPSTINVPGFGQTLVNVNALNTTANFAGATPQVSTEVSTAAAAKSLVVQREQFFNYHHSFQVNGNTETTQAAGMTDVMGQIGPVSATVYSFAEGYTNTNYNEWLTVQNPTANNEVVWITMVNELSQKATVGLAVLAHSRATLDIAATVRQYLATQTGPLYINNNQVSLIVQTYNNGGAFLVERPMYWNTAGTGFVTQGGDDIIGYAGG